MKDCRGCRYCFLEPDDDFCCGHEEAGPYGVYTKLARQLGDICGPEAKLYEADPRDFRKAYQPKEEW